MNAEQSIRNKPQKHLLKKLGGLKNRVQELERHIMKCINEGCHVDLAISEEVMFALVRLDRVSQIHNVAHGGEIDEDDLITEDCLPS